MTLLLFVLDVYKWQARRGKYFLHEHPWTATSWRVEEVQELLQRSGVEAVRGDSCQYGMRVTDADGQSRAARKATGWMSNAPMLLEELSARCQGLCGQHADLKNGRAAQTAIYPPELCTAIIRGLQRQWEADRVELAPEIVAAVRSEEDERATEIGQVDDPD